MASLRIRGGTREIVSTGKMVATEIHHYAGPGASTPSWTGELSSNYTRYITGIGGRLAAVQDSSEAPTLHLSNRQGDIVATATDSETATALASTVGEASEYGVPATEAPPKFSWLGAHEMPTSLPSGVTAMGARSYVPQLGRFLQSDPRPGGSANSYVYTYGDPVNSNDLTGEYTATIDERDGRPVSANSAASWHCGSPKYAPPKKPPPEPKPKECSHRSSQRRSVRSHARRYIALRSKLRRRRRRRMGRRGVSGLLWGLRSVCLRWR
jgi:RHS repeat-associated protein